MNFGARQGIVLEGKNSKAAERYGRGARPSGGMLHAFAAAALCLPFAVAPAAANPLGGEVVGGQATIATTAPNTLTIQQATPRAAINWQSFNIAPNETTQFVQPSSSAIALNRVQAGDPSTIAGRLNANGQLILTTRAGSRSPAARRSTSTA